MLTMDARKDSGSRMPLKNTARKSVPGTFNRYFLDSLPQTVLLPDIMETSEKDGKLPCAFSEWLPKNYGREIQMDIEETIKENGQSVSANEKCSEGKTVNGKCAAAKASKSVGHLKSSGMPDLSGAQSSLQSGECAIKDYVRVDKENQQTENQQSKIHLLPPPGRLKSCERGKVLKKSAAKSLCDKVSMQWNSSGGPLEINHVVQLKKLKAELKNSVVDECEGVTRLNSGHCKTLNEMSKKKASNHSNKLMGKIPSHLSLSQSKHRPHDSSHRSKERPRHRGVDELVDKSYCGICPSSETIPKKKRKDGKEMSRKEIMLSDREVEVKTKPGEKKEEKAKRKKQVSESEGRGHSYELLRDAKRKRENCEKKHTSSDNSEGINQKLELNGIIGSENTKSPMVQNREKTKQSCNDSLKDKHIPKCSSIVVKKDDIRLTESHKIGTYSSNKAKHVEIHSSYQHKMGSSQPSSSGQINILDKTHSSKTLSGSGKHRACDNKNRGCENRGMSTRHDRHYSGDSTKTVKRKIKGNELQNDQEHTLDGSGAKRKKQMTESHNHKGDKPECGSVIRRRPEGVSQKCGTGNVNCIEERTERHKTKHRPVSESRRRKEEPHQTNGVSSSKRTKESCESTIHSNASTEVKGQRHLNESNMHKADLLEASSERNMENIASKKQVHSTVNPKPLNQKQEYNCVETTFLPSEFIDFTEQKQHSSDSVDMSNTLKWKKRTKSAEDTVREKRINPAIESQGMSGNKRIDQRSQSPGSSKNKNVDQRSESQSLSENEMIYQRNESQGLSENKRIGQRSESQGLSGNKSIDNRSEFQNKRDVRKQCRTECTATKVDHRSESQATQGHKRTDCRSESQEKTLDKRMRHRSESTKTKGGRIDHRSESQEKYSDKRVNHASESNDKPRDQRLNHKNESHTCREKPEVLDSSKTVKQTAGSHRAGGTISIKGLTNPQAQGLPASKGTYKNSNSCMSETDIAKRRSGLLENPVMLKKNFHRKENQITTGDQDAKTEIIRKSDTESPGKEDNGQKIEKDSADPCDKGRICDKTFPPDGTRDEVVTCLNQKGANEMGSGPLPEICSAVHCDRVSDLKKHSGDSVTTLRRSISVNSETQGKLRERRRTQSADGSKLSHNSVRDKMKKMYSTFCAIHDQKFQMAKSVKRHIHLSEKLDDSLDERSPGSPSDTLFIVTDEKCDSSVAEKQLDHETDKSDSVQKHDAAQKPHTGKNGVEAPADVAQMWGNGHRGKQNSEQNILHSPPEKSGPSNDSLPTIQIIKQSMSAESTEITQPEVSKEQCGDQADIQQAKVRQPETLNLFEKLLSEGFPGEYAKQQDKVKWQSSKCVTDPNNSRVPTEEQHYCSKKTLQQNGEKVLKQIRNCKFMNGKAFTDITGVGNSLSLGTDSGDLETEHCLPQQSSVNNDVNTVNDTSEASISATTLVSSDKHSATDEDDSPCDASPQQIDGCSEPLPSVSQGTNIMECSKTPPLFCDDTSNFYFHKNITPRQDDGQSITVNNNSENGIIASESSSFPREDETTNGGKEETDESRKRLGDVSGTYNSNETQNCAQVTDGKEACNSQETKLSPENKFSEDRALETVSSREEDNVCYHNGDKSEQMDIENIPTETSQAVGGQMHHRSGLVQPREPNDGYGQEGAVCTIPRNQWERICIPITHCKITTLGTKVTSRGVVWPQFFFVHRNRCICCLTCHKWMNPLDFLAHYDSLPVGVEIQKLLSLSKHEIQPSGELSREQKFLWDQFCWDLKNARECWAKNKEPQPPEAWYLAQSRQAPPIVNTTTIIQNCGHVQAELPDHPHPHSQSHNDDDPATRLPDALFEGNMALWPPDDRRLSESFQNMVSARVPDVTPQASQGLPSQHQTSGNQGLVALQNHVSSNRRSVPLQRQTSGTHLQGVSAVRECAPSVHARTTAENRSFGLTPAAGTYAAAVHQQSAPNQFQGYQQYSQTHNLIQRENCNQVGQNQSPIGQHSNAVWPNPTPSGQNHGASFQNLALSGQSPDIPSQNFALSEWNLNASLHNLQNPDVHSQNLTFQNLPLSGQNPNIPSQNPILSRRNHGHNPKIPSCENNFASFQSHTMKHNHTRVSRHHSASHAQHHLTPFQNQTSPITHNNASLNHASVHSPATNNGTPEMLHSVTNLTASGHSHAASLRSSTSSSQHQNSSVHVSPRAQNYTLSIPISPTNSAVEKCALSKQHSTSSLGSRTCIKNKALAVRSSSASAENVTLNTCPTENSTMGEHNQVSTYQKPNPSWETASPELSPVSEISVRPSVRGVCTMDTAHGSSGGEATLEQVLDPDSPDVAGDSWMQESREPSSCKSDHGQVTSPQLPSTDIVSDTNGNGSRGGPGANMSSKGGNWIQSCHYICEELSDCGKIEVLAKIASVYDTLRILMWSQRWHNRILRRLCTERNTQKEEIKRLKLELKDEIHEKTKLQSSMTSLLAEVRRLRGHIAEMSQSDVPLDCRTNNQTDSR